MRVSRRTGALTPVHGFSKWRSPTRQITFWRTHDGLYVGSELAVMQLPGAADGVTGPTWYLTTSRHGDHRPTAVDLERVVDCFELDDGWDEDNHYPGITRGIFIPVDPTWRRVCECKLTETVIVDPADGFQWTTPTDGPCRGCEHRDRIAAHGLNRPCPIHDTDGVA